MEGLEVRLLELNNDFIYFSNTSLVACPTDSFKACLGWRGG